MKDTDFIPIRVPVFFLTLFILILFLLTACGLSEATPTITDESDEPLVLYPAPEIVRDEAQEGYPAPTQTTPQEQVYPPPSPEVVVDNPYPDPVSPQDGTLVALNRPIRRDDGVINGVGVPGLTVFLVNVTSMGEPLGSGVIDDDGMFAVDVGDLESGIQIGLAADIVGFGLMADDIIPGEGEMSIPQVGYFYDTVVVREN